MYLDVISIVIGLPAFGDIRNRSIDEKLVARLSRFAHLSTDSQTVKPCSMESSAKPVALAEPRRAGRQEVPRGLPPPAAVEKEFAVCGARTP